MIIRPFRALTPTPEYAQKVACVPYDVVDRDEAYALAHDNPLSLLHVDRAEINLPPDTDPYSSAVYALAAQNLQRLITQGVLRRESQPLFCLYRQIMGGHSQVGLVATVRACDYEAGLVKKHEKTRPEKEDDRTRLIDTINAQTGPILLAYRGIEELDAVIAASLNDRPDYDFIAEDGIRHTLWKVFDTEPIAKAFDSVAAVYIADGHHRAASGARVAAMRRGRDGIAPGTDAPSEQILSVLFPANQLQVLPYNRLVYDLNGLSPETFLSKVSEIFQVAPAASPHPTGPRQVAMYLAGKWYSLFWEEDPALDPVSRLDVSVLQDRLLGPVLGIEDPRTSKKIEFVGGIRGPEELVRKIDAGEAAVGFSMFATTVQQVMDIADAGQIMPPKSTWFEPKLRSGLFVHVLDAG